MTMARHHMRRGFTLTELLMVVVVLAIASALIAPLAGNDEGTALRATAELLAADIEDVQARTLANPIEATCLVPRADGSGWHIALVQSPYEPIESIDGQALERSFGSGALASATTIRLRTPPLPENRLTFDDQGAPVSIEGPVHFEIIGTEKDRTLKVVLSAATGRVSIAR